ncbi:MAG TPA: hypothetical protein VFM06_07175 [Candidatus Limnocylindria bacterium]|nr:hypothetical protein [Candidatus Limnocylindria bacterium]
MSRRRPRRDIAEVVTLIVSIAVVAALVGGVIFVQLARGERPPAIEATASLGEVRTEGGRFYLPIEIGNTGDQAAEAVVVVVVQRVGERDIEHEILIDHLAGRATADATAILMEDPRRSEVRIEVRSFQRK